ncbi:MAG: thiol:disulfide interchange protein DsbA/DsbL [Pseudomonadota bacterium]
MQRREFSRTVGFSALSAAGLAALGAHPAHAQGKPPVNGTDFLTLDKPAAVDAAPGKIEVVEFFWYSCPHCNQFEPQFDAWTKKVPADVSVRRVPVSFRPDFEPQQRLYYVLEAMGKVEEMHKKVFAAIHVDKQLLNTPDLIAAWAEKQGLGKAKFTELYNSFPVNTKVRKATQLQDQFQVDGVPALGVAGRFYTSASLAGTMDRALQVTEFLIGQARKKGAKA